MDISNKHGGVKEDVVFYFDALFMSCNCSSYFFMYTLNNLTYAATEALLFSMLLKQDDNGVHVSVVSLLVACVPNVIQARLQCLVISCS